MRVNPQNNAQRSQSDADVFSRGSLQLTFTLLRKKHPKLALAIRNIQGQEPLPKNSDETDSKNSDLFVVDIDSMQVRAVVEALMECQSPSGSANVAGESSGISIMAKALINDWVLLAQLMISRLKNAE